MAPKPCYPLLTLALQPGEGFGSFKSAGVAGVRPPGIAGQGVGPLLLDKPCALESRKVPTFRAGHLLGPLPVSYTCALLYAPQLHTCSYSGTKTVYIPRQHDEALPAFQMYRTVYLSTGLVDVCCWQCRSPRFSKQASSLSLSPSLSLSLSLTVVKTSMSTRSSTPNEYSREAAKDDIRHASPRDQLVLHQQLLLLLLLL